MEILFASVVGILGAQLAVLSGIFLRLGGMKEGLEALKTRVRKLEEIIQ